MLSHVTKTRGTIEHLKSFSCLNHFGFVNFLISLLKLLQLIRQFKLKSLCNKKVFFSLNYMYMYLVNSIFSACMLVPSLIMIVINRSERPSNPGHRET